MQAPPLPQPDSTSSPVWKPPESTDSPASRVVAVSALPTSAVLPRRTPMAAVSPAGSGSPAARPRMSMLPPSASTEASEMSTPTWVLPVNDRSEEHTSELQSLMRISYAVFCLKKKTYQQKYIYTLPCSY